MNQPLNVFDDATARDLVKLVRLFRANGWLNGQGVAEPQVFSAEAVTVHNDSGEEIPAYACMKVSDTEEVGEENCALVIKPDTAYVPGDGPYLFNGPDPIADNDEGTAQGGPVYRVLRDSGDATGIANGDYWAPIEDSWYVEKNDDGPFWVLGADDLDDDMMRMVEVPQRPPQIYSFTLTGNMSGTPGTANATINELDLTLYKSGETVQDDLGYFGWMQTGQNGHCVRHKGVYHVIGPYVTHVQWDDPDLEYSRDGGTNWTNIDTAEDCDA